jgi:hypothetical protein
MLYYVIDGVILSYYQTNYFNKIKVIVQLNSSISNKLIDTIAKAKAKAKSTPAVVILVDDLDRCKDSYVVTFLQEIQTLFRTAKLSCVVAADRRWIYTSFEKAYENFGSAISEPGYPFGKLFLDKIFQFSVPMPSISNKIQRRYWEYLLNPAYDKKTFIEYPNKTFIEAVEEKLNAHC